MRMLFTLAWLVCSTGNAQPVRQQPVGWSLDHGLCEPETVLHDPVRDLLVVSNICGFKANGEGYLSLLHPDGSYHQERWLEGLNAPAGMAIKARYLYVADLDRVRVIELDTGNIVETLTPQPAAKALNDIAIDHNGTIYVSDSARHQVIKIERDAYALFPSDTARFEYANGLHIDAQGLWVGGTELHRIDLATKRIEKVQINGLNDIDGIDGDGAGGLTISQVGGPVWQLPNDQMPVVWTAPGVSSANHAYLPGRNLFVVPTGYDNTIVAFSPDGKLLKQAEEQ